MTSLQCPKRAPARFYIEIPYIDYMNSYGRKETPDEYAQRHEELAAAAAGELDLTSELSATVELDQAAQDLQGMLDTLIGSSD